MTFAIKKLIALSNHLGPVYIGRNYGESLRRQYALDETDSVTSETVEVSIPHDAYAVSSSFFLGLFGPSIVKAGSSSAFFEKYIFTAPAHFRSAFAGYVENVIQAQRFTR